LGIGVYGNKTRAPDISGKELSKALIKVLGNKSYLEKAAKLQKLCHKKEGRVAAAERIADLATRKDKSMITVPEPKVDDPSLLKVKNKAGVVLETTKSPKAFGSKYVISETSSSSSLSSSSSGPAKLTSHLDPSSEDSPRSSP
jgi:2-acylglycerol O-acyltransferase 1